RRPAVPEARRLGPHGGVYHALREKAAVECAWRYRGEYRAARPEGTAGRCRADRTALLHEDAINLDTRLHVHAEGIEQRAERGHEPTGAPRDHRKTEAVQDSREQWRHQAAGGVVRGEPGMQQPWGIQVIDLVSVELPAQIRPTA